MSRKNGILSLVVFAVCFSGLNLTLRYGGMNSIPSLVLVVGGLLGGSLVGLMPFSMHISIHGWPELKKNYLFELGVVVVTASAIPFWLQAEGLSRTTASKAGIIFSLIPVLTTVLSRIMLERKATRSLWIRIATMVGGGILISWEGTQATVNTGDLMIFGATFSFALSNVFAYRLLQNWPIHALIQARLFLGGCLLVPLLFYTNSLQFEYTGGLFWLIPLISFLFIGVFYGVYYGLIALGPELATLFDIISALLTVVAAFFLFDETLMLHQLIGGGLIVLTAGHLVRNIWLKKEKLVKTA